LLHQRFPDTFSIPLAQQLERALLPTPKAQLNTMSTEQREREETVRVSRQRTLSRVFVDLWLAGIFAGMDSGKEKDRPIRTDDDMVYRSLHELVIFK
jgi:regulator of nonsense transcripts 2